jgi:hypothetical protein
VLGFGSRFSNQSLSTPLLLRAGQQYAFSSEISFMATILKMQNLTTGRVTRLDTYHMVFYDESGTPLPPDDPFAP